MQNGVCLSGVGTFRLGGEVQTLVDCATACELGMVREIFQKEGIPPLLLGGGSNVLFSDEGWSGCLVRYLSPFHPPSRPAKNLFRVCAGVDLDALANWACESGWAGLEAFSGIPGTVGGAVVGNAGAWGVQMEHVLDRVFGWDGEGSPREWSVPECGFQYRDSLLKHNGAWVGEVSLRLRREDPAKLIAERQRILTLRAQRHPDWKTTPCIGSFFKNLEPTSAAERRMAAGWFLETAGAKGMEMGGAAVFPGHANILIKARPDCQAADVAALARALRDKVREVHGIELTREVRYLGAIPGETPGPGFY